MMLLLDPPIEPRFVTPSRALRAMHRELGRWFELPFTAPSSVPPLALYSRKDGLLLRSPMPGVDASALELQIDGDLLTLSGEWRAEPADAELVPSRRERPRGRFTRTLRLPYEVESSGVEARLERGVLEVKLPRAEKSRPIQIQVRSEEKKKE